MKGMHNIPEGKVKRWLGDYMVSPMAHGEAYDLGRQAARFKSKLNLSPILITQYTIK